jgi:diacylglycerol kinase family enzyme
MLRPFSSKSAVAVTNGSGRHLASRSRVRHGALTVTVSRPGTALRLSVGHLMIARGRLRSSTLTITVIDARGVKTKLQLTLHT